MWIRDDDLKLVEAASAGVVAAASFAEQPPTLRALASVAAAVMRVLWSVRTKGAQFGPLENVVLATLRARDEPWTIADIHENINAAISDEAPTWTAQDIENALQTLAAARLRDGSVAAFAAKTPDGLWSDTGV